jgi:NAD(P)-dependent dehydrogenase (short-subunit alcohol dehydrogenase family)
MSHGRFDNPVIASLAGFLDRFRKQERASRLTAADRFDGKSCVITGTNSGLGFALAVEMASRGAHVVMANRNREVSTVERIKKLSGSEIVEQRYMDLTKIGTIHDFVEGLVTDGIRPEVTILNAGVALPKPRRTGSGQDEMFQVNFLSNVILTGLMLEKGVISKETSQTPLPRILFISSDSHQGCSAIDYSEFGRYYEYGISKGIENYSYFKLVMNTFMVELSRRLNAGKVRAGVHVICPGPVHSNITRPAPQPLRFILNLIFFLIFRSPSKAALPVIYMSISPDYEGKTGEYLHMFKTKRMDPKVYEPEEGARLWDATMELWKRVDPGYTGFTFPASIQT